MSQAWSRYFFLVSIETRSKYADNAIPLRRILATSLYEHLAATDCKSENMAHNFVDVHGLLLSRHAAVFFKQFPGLTWSVGKLAERCEARTSGISLLSMFGL